MDNQQPSLCFAWLRARWKLASNF